MCVFVDIYTSHQMRCRMQWHPSFDHFTCWLTNLYVLTIGYQFVWPWFAVITGSREKERPSSLMVSFLGHRAIVATNLKWVWSGSYWHQDHAVWSPYKIVDTILFLFVSPKRICYDCVLLTWMSVWCKGIEKCFCTTQAVLNVWNMALQHQSGYFYGYIFSWYPLFSNFACAKIGAFSFISNPYLALYPNFTLFFLFFFLFPLFSWNGLTQLWKLLSDNLAIYTLYIIHSLHEAAMTSHVGKSWTKKQNKQIKK